MIGVIKAYTTRVGSRPVPDGAPSTRTARSCGKSAARSASSTGRDRRCGWYDAVIARYAARVNGLTDLFLTKLDVLSELGARAGLRGLATVEGRGIDEMPMTQTEFHPREPVYEASPAGGRTSRRCRKFADLPEERPRIHRGAAGHVGCAV